MAMSTKATHSNQMYPCVTALYYEAVELKSEDFYRHPTVAYRANFRYK